MKTKQKILISLFAALTAVGAFIKLPIPYVPLTMQLFFVLLSGILLGGKYGLYSQLLYIVIGLIGIPVFTNGGGIAYVLQPTFGYLLGFACASYLVGKITEYRDRLPFYFLAMYLGLIVVYLFGVIYLYGISHYLINPSFTLKQSVWFGAIVCLPSDLIITTLTALLGYKLKRRIEGLKS